MKKYMVIDCETTGLDKSKNSIITFSGKCYDESSTLLSSVDVYNKSWIESAVSLSALKVNGHCINSFNIDGYVTCHTKIETARTIANWFLAASPCDYIVGFNVKFDISFIEELFACCNLEADRVIPYKIIDPFVLANIFIDNDIIKGSNGVSAKSLYEYFGIEANSIHKSSYDVEYTWQLYKKMSLLLTNNGAAKQ